MLQSVVEIPFFFLTLRSDECFDTLKHLIMKKILSYMVLGVASVMLFCACSGGNTKANEEAMASQAERINLDLGSLAEESPMFLSAASADYADKALSINLEFCDSIIKVDQISDVLIRYVLGQYMKNHAGENLDITLNTLGKLEGVMSITLKDIYGETKVLVLPSATLKKLVTSKQMELGYQDVRVNVFDIMETRCERYKKAVNAQSVEFKYAAGFAQYTFTFKNARAFANQTQGTLAGRYLGVLKPTFDNFGACRPILEELLSSLQIEGYRFVYMDDAETRKIHVSLPWRMIN